MALADDPEKLSKLLAVGERLALDAGTAEVFASFDRAGLHALLLKGPSIAGWLYSDPRERSYIDCDVLVGPADFAAAEATLRSLGYTSLLGDLGMPAWWCEHAAVWRRPGDGLSVDLHRTLVGIKVGHNAAWHALSSDPVEVVVAGRRVPALGLPRRALHVALHAAQHGADWQPSIADLERALGAEDDDLWRQAAALAAELGAIAAFVAGLRLVPAGQALAARLGLSDVRSVEAELRVGSPPPLALGIERLAQAPGMRARAEILWRKLAPTADFLQDADPRAYDGRLSVGRAYVRRWRWLLSAAPAALWEWWRVRRAVRGRG